VDPRREILPSADPLKPADLPAFDQVRDEFLARMDEAESEAKTLSVATF
jgi:hypothetical protein